MEKIPRMKMTLSSSRRPPVSGEPKHHSLGRRLNLGQEVILSNRTIIEISHDFASDIALNQNHFMMLLGQYLRSCDKEAAEALKLHFGVNIIGTAHHSEKRIVIMNGEETVL
jgi:hypothetical protein